MEELLKEMVEELKKPQGGPCPELLKKESNLIGKPVDIAGTPYTGNIVGINKSKTGFYPGSRYPYLVRIDAGEHEASGMVFEYTENQVKFL